MKTRFILLVEDSDDDALLFNRVVNRADLNIQMRRVRNGQEAIDYLLGIGAFRDREENPLPDVVILDLKMPVCDGFDFLAWKRTRPALLCLPTIVMTSSQFDNDIRRSYELGAHSYVMKVKATDTLQDRVEALRKWWFEHCIVISPAENLAGP